MSMVITTNKKAYHEYEILEKIEAGIALQGDEVKSIRNKHVSINEAFATIHGGELMLINCHISPYSHAYQRAVDERRSRKLLLNKKEINKLIGTIARKGLTLIPLKLYLNDRGYVKVELGLAKHKKKADKKQALKERDIKRETDREMRNRW